MMLRTLFTFTISVLFPINQALSSQDLAVVPLTDEDIRSAKSVYSHWNWEKIEGDRIASEGRAFVEMFGNTHGTNRGLCFRPKLSLGWVPIVDGSVAWKPLNPEHSIKVERQVWFPRADEKLDCDDVVEPEAILVNSDIEQNTLIRLYREAPALLLEASALDKRLGIPENIGQARVESIRIESLYRNGTYGIDLRVRQCLGYSVYVTTTETGGFKPVEVYEVVC